MMMEISNWQSSPIILLLFVILFGRYGLLAGFDTLNGKLDNELKMLKFLSSVGLSWNAKHMEKCCISAHAFDSFAINSYGNRQREREYWEIYSRATWASGISQFYRLSVWHRKINGECVACRAKLISKCGYIRFTVATLFSNISRRHSYQRTTSVFSFFLSSTIWMT